LRPGIGRVRDTSARLESNAQPARHDEPIAAVKDDGFAGFDVPCEAPAFPRLDDDWSGVTEDDPLVVGEGERRHRGRPAHRPALAYPGTALPEGEPGPRGNRTPHARPRRRGPARDDHERTGQAHECETAAQRCESD